MSLLDQLWDDTVAGPQPENGLGKLRKQSTFNFRSNSGSKEVSDGGSVRSYGDEQSTGEGVKVTRRIMIVKPPGYNYSSPPASPAGSTPPEVESYTVSGGGQHQMRMIKQVMLDPGVFPILVLTTCELRDIYDLMTTANDRRTYLVDASRCL
ncbi:hypothetical protein ACFE04_006468 [Oxalis oulophora]